ncbi:MAG TPA: hypothetical protein VFL62_07915, partial [Bradyrhizobium sp.]|uniref:hypothetical protein n=1 Tax=Bradyrhizobium sp. TaxID=376 RepID=UPI002D803189
EFEMSRDEFGPRAIEVPVRRTKARSEPTNRLGRDMQWYVFLIMIPAVFFLGQIAVELLGQPIQAILQLRQRALERLLAFRDITLPEPRETAVSSRQIREHDWAAQNVRQAQLTFGALGAQLVALSETERTVCGLMTFCGLDLALAGHELINLSEAYGSAKCASDGAHRAIEDAYHAASCALAVSRRRSGGDRLTKIRLEPMYLRDTPSRRRQRWSGRTRTTGQSGHSRASSRHIGPRRGIRV